MLKKTQHYKYFDAVNLKKLRSMNLIARYLVEGFISGLHRSPHKGFSVEFAEYKKYVLGDDIRRIDWKVYPKTHKLYIKEYQEETNLRCYILLDTSTSMSYGSGEVTKLDYASFLASALSYLMIKQNDGVGLTLFSDRISTFIPPKGSPSQLKTILIELEKVKPTYRTDISRAFHSIAGRIRRRGLIVVISDFYDEPDRVIKALKHFRHKKHEVLVFHLFDKNEVDFPFDGLVNFKDLETGHTVQLYPQALRDEYKEKLGTFVRDYQRSCSDSNIEYLMVNTDTPYDVMLASYLAKRSVLG
jgi:uncharacterized protein (DUF58 family)